MTDPEVSNRLREISYYESDLNDVITNYEDVSVTNRNNIFDLSSAYSLSGQRDIYGNTNGSVTHEVNEYHLSTNSNSSGSAYLESSMLGVYVPDYVGVAGQAIRTSGDITGSKDQSWGYYNGDDGAYFGRDSGGMYVALKRNGSINENEKVYQDNWNQDTLDGSGDEHNPSGYELHPEYGNIYHEVLALYDDGTIRFEVLLTNGRIPDNGRDLKIVPVHSMSPQGKPTLRIQNLPVGVYINDNGDESPQDLYVAGRQYSIKGNYTAVNRVKSEFRLSQSIGTSWTPIMSLKRKTGTSNQQVVLSILGYDVLTDTNLIVQLRTNATVTGGSYTTPSTVDPEETAVNTNKTPTGVTISSGNQRSQYLLKGGQGSHTGFANFSGIDITLNRQQIGVMAARSVSGTATVSSVMRWQEEW